MNCKIVFSLLIGVTLMINEVSAQGRRRVKKVRVRGRSRNNFAEPAQPVQPAATARLECPKPEGLQVYEDPDSCNHFYRCANGTLTYEECENGLLFDSRFALAGSAHNHCTYNWQADCGLRRADETAISTPGCDYSFGLFPVGECQPTYYKCAFGQPADIPCDIGLVFNPVTRACDWPDQQLDLGCDPSALLGGFTCPPASELSDLARRFLPFPRFPVDGQPDLYILCVNDLPRLQACGPGNVFDPSVYGCVEY